jgi:hypothetical protein
MTASVIGVLLVAAPGAQAAPDPQLKVTDVTLGRSSVAVSGLNTVAVPIRVKGGWDSTDPNDENLPLVVYLQRTGGTGPLLRLYSTDLVRVAGTLQDGEWAGPVNVPSTANGTFKVIGATRGPFFSLQFSSPPPDPTPFDGPTLVIAGSHLPKITAKVNPPVVPVGAGFTITWAVIDSATGKPYGTRLRVILGTDNECAEGGSAVLFTSTAGLLIRSYPASGADFLQCLQLPGVPVAVGGLGLVPARPGIVSAVPSRTSAPVGTVVPVNGSVAGAPYRCIVVLQRLYGATQWRGVNVGDVRASGRFTVSAQPAYKGLIPYRVYFPTCHRYQAGLSRIFYIRGL